MGHSLDSAPTATHFTHHYHTQNVHTVFIYMLRGLRFCTLVFTVRSYPPPCSLRPSASPSPAVCARVRGPPDGPRERDAGRCQVMADA